MTKQKKIKWHLAVAGALFLTIAFTACNNDGEQEKPAEEPVKTEAPAPAVVDSMDSVPGSVSPVVETKPK